MEVSLLRPFPREFMVFQWHGNTFELPKGAVRLVSSNDYVNQAIRIGTMSYGFQFHVEITKEMIFEWLETDRDELQE